jgi:hypothetical protein
VGVAIYADATRIMVIEKAARQMRLSQTMSILAIAKEVMC